MKDRVFEKEIYHETLEGLPLYYKIKIVITNSLKDGVSGEYYPETNPPSIIIKKDCRNFTIYHEALHACIDFFRKVYPEGFDDLFEPKTKFGEEAFICYYEQFCNAVLESVKEEARELI